MSRLSLVAAIIALLGAVTVPTASGQGKPPKGDVSVPADITFRCNATNPGDATCPAGGTTAVPPQDHITGDLQGAYTGGWLGASFSLRLENGRALMLTLQAPIGDSRTSECYLAGALAACNPDDRLPSLNGSSMSLSPVEIIVRVLDPNNYELAAGGLPGMACGVEQLALVSFTTWLDGGEGHWGLNFNPREMYHSTGATVKRVNTTTWVAYADTTQYAELVSFNHSGIRRKAGPSHEGRFVVPFAFTITASGVTTTGHNCAP